MEAGAAVRAGHLTIARIKLATLAEGEAVGVVFAEELVRSRLHQRDEGLGGGVHQLAVDRLKVGDVRVVGQLCLLVDVLEPLHVAIAGNWIAAQVEGGDCHRVR